jgi:hypothetical protein
LRLFDKALIQRAFRGAAGSKPLPKLERLHVQSSPVVPQLGDAAVSAQGNCFGEELRLDSLRGRAMSSRISATFNAR